MEEVLDNIELEKYESCQDSGIDWIGEIPSHWRVHRIKYLFDEINDRSTSGDEDLLSVSHYTGVTKRSDSIADGDLVTNAESLEGYKKVNTGDLVSNIMLAWNGSLGFSPFEGITSPAYGIYRLKREDDRRYFHYLFRSEFYKAEFKRNSYGVIESRLRLYTDDFFRIWAVQPPKEEQTRIANFLDKKTTQIDQAIAQKEQLIELLKERRQIMIHKAVTQGLNPNVKMKDSGVEWIGEIPEHWEVEKSQWLFQERKERARKDDEQLTSSQKHGVILQSTYMEIEGRRVTQVEFNKEIQKHVEVGDFMISMRSFQGGIEFSSFQGCISSAYIPLIPGKKIQSRFYKYLFKTRRYIEALQSTSNLVRDGQALRFENFKQVPLLVISKKEQIEIADYLDSCDKKISSAIEQQFHQIEKLKGYKTILIDSAVTGKIKV